MKAKIIIGIFLITVITGCSSSFVKSDYDQDVNFTNYRTFDWKVQPQKSGSDPLAQNTLLEKRIKNAVEKELTAKGLQKQTTDKPDFLIVYYIIVEDKMNVPSYGYGYRSRYYGYGYDVGQYKEGTLILDFIDPELNQLVWRGLYTGEVDSREITKEEITKAVKKILEEFPPEQVAITDRSFSNTEMEFVSLTTLKRNRLYN